MDTKQLAELLSRPVLSVVLQSTIYSAELDGTIGVSSVVEVKDKRVNTFVSAESGLQSLGFLRDFLSADAIRLQQRVALIDKFIADAETEKRVLSTEKTDVEYAKTSEQKRQCRTSDTTADVDKT